MKSRRDVVALLGAGLVGLGVAPDALAGPRRRAVRRTVRRVRRRRFRRRHRRRVRRRVVAGRSMVVVPVAAAVGWELVVDDKVYVVEDTKKDGDVEIFIIKSGGETTEIAVIREDDDTNSVEMEGSELADGDTSTPGVDAEEEIEE